MLVTLGIVMHTVQGFMHSRDSVGLEQRGLFVGSRLPRGGLPLDKFAKLTG